MPQYKTKDLCVCGRGCVVFLPVFMNMRVGFFLFFCLGFLLVLLLCLAQLEWSVLGIVIWIQAQYHKLRFISHECPESS